MPEKIVGLLPGTDWHIHREGPEVLSVPVAGFIVFEDTVGGSFRVSVLAVDAETGRSIVERPLVEGEQLTHHRDPLFAGSVNPAERAEWLRDVAGLTPKQVRDHIRNFQARAYLKQMADEAIEDVP